MRLQKNHVVPAFYGIADAAKFQNGIRDTVASVRPGVFAGDNLITFGRSLGFLDDSDFTTAFFRSAQEMTEKAALWRTYVLCWAAWQALRLEGDFVECGCYKGTSARIVVDYVNFGAETGRRFFLYDLFEHDDTMTHHAMPEHGVGLYEQVKARFADLSNVVVAKGSVPRVLDDMAPSGPIAFLHIDMNDRDAELGALERLFDQVVTGAPVVFDDYGWAGYIAQKLAEDEFMAARGYRVLELPTGQGLVIK